MKSELVGDWKSSGNGGEITAKITLLPPIARYSHSIV
jgi:hypothetical protein